MQFYYNHLQMHNVCIKNKQQASVTVLGWHYTMGFCNINHQEGQLVCVEFNPVSQNDLFRGFYDFCVWRLSGKAVFLFLMSSGIATQQYSHMVTCIYEIYSQKQSFYMFICTPRHDTSEYIFTMHMHGSIINNYVGYFYIICLIYSICILPIVHYMF